MLETKTAPFTFVKQGIFYFSRRVPSDLSHHYSSNRIMYSLRTRSVTVAASRSQRAAQQLDEQWYHLRIRDVDLPGKHLLRMAGQSGAVGQAHPLEATATIWSTIPKWPPLLTGLAIAVFGSGTSHRTERGPGRLHPPPLRPA